MYKIVGADQKEYGPVSADQLRQWIREGRVNGNTLVLAEGGTAWQPLSSIPELAAALPATGPLPGTPAFTAPDTDTIRRKVAAPAICLLIVGILTIVFSLFNAGSYFLGGATEKTGNEFLDRVIENSNKPATLIVNGLQLLCGIVMTMSALKMKKLQGHKAALTSSIFAMLPCTASCCCLIGLPIGIWCLVVLNQSDVKSAFDS